MNWLDRLLARFIKWYAGFVLGEHWEATKPKDGKVQEE